MDLDTLDRRAAEKVMGWESSYNVWYNPAEADKRDPRGKFVMSHNQWQPTRRIEQAWDCLEKLGLVFAVTVRPKPRKYTCEIWMGAKGYQFSEDETAPLAIVKACLKARGIEV